MTTTSPHNIPLTMVDLSQFTLKDNKIDQLFFGRGKVLLTGEYFVCGNAKSLALPLNVGQSLSVKYSPSFNPKLYWSSLDLTNQQWLQTKFEFWRFDFLDDTVSDNTLFLQEILRQCRKQNSHFLRDEVDIHVETKLSFPINWGLGSSSTLIYSISQWANVDPFEILFKTSGGSGYDIACAQSGGPIFYQKEDNKPVWTPVSFDPVFKGQLYFIHLGRKQDSREAVSLYQRRQPFPKQTTDQISEITEHIIEAKNLIDFDELIVEHENIISRHLGLDKVKNKYFADFWGEMKSLGAWGGDFVIASSSRSPAETKKYFTDKGFDVFIPYSDLVQPSLPKESLDERLGKNGKLQ